VTVASASPPLPFTSSLEAEAAILAHADDALKAGDPDQALSILGDLSARYPTSALAPERAAERVLALCLAGRVDEARAARAEFDALNQTGPLAARVHASCAKP
jgi:outer membrane protein assembly factor BamD (BamD/ComL family)